MEKVILHCKCGNEYVTSLKIRPLDPPLYVEESTNVCPKCKQKYRKEGRLVSPPMRHVHA